MDSSLAFRIASQAALFLPRRVVYFLGEKMGIAYAMSQGEEKNAVRENLRQILGREIAQKELEAMTPQVYVNFAKYLIDFFRVPKVNHSFIDRYVSFEGIEEVDRALEKKKGCLLLTAHVGSWEVGGAILATLGHPMKVIALSHKNPWIDQFFLKQRLSKGIRSIPVQTALKGALAGLRQNHVVAILGDRDYTRQGIPARFLGKTVSFPRGTAYLAIRTGAPIVPIFVLREKGDCIRVLCKKPIENSHFGDGSDQAIQALTQECARVLEEEIRLHPTQWLVFRRFWEPITET